MSSKSIWGNVLRGVAIGDAWGNPNEFLPIDMLTAKDRRGVDLPERLEVTDDTQMTLYLAQAINSTLGRPIPDVQEAIAKAFIAYTHDPDFASRAPGVTVTGSLRRLESGMPWHLATDDYSDGCGTVMRVTPAAFADDWAGIAAFSAAITHGTPNGIAAALLNAATLRYAWGTAKFTDELPLTQYAYRVALNPGPLLNVERWLTPLQVDLKSGFRQCAEVLHRCKAALPQFRADPWATDPCEVGGGGWRAHECLAVALLSVDACFHDPWEALRRAVTTDGDSDSIGAVAGGLLGARYGAFWPSTALERLEPRYQVEIAGAANFDLSIRREALS